MTFSKLKKRKPKALVIEVQNGDYIKRPDILKVTDNEEV